MKLDRIRHEIRRHWNDPVWSKVIANTIWAVLTGSFVGLCFVIRWLILQIHTSQILKAPVAIFSFRMPLWFLCVCSLSLLPFVSQVIKKLFRGTVALLAYFRSVVPQGSVVTSRGAAVALQFVAFAKGRGVGLLLLCILALVTFLSFYLSLHFGKKNIRLVATHNVGCQWSQAIQGSNIGKCLASDRHGGVVWAGPFRNTVHFGGADFTLTSAGEDDICIAHFDSDGRCLLAERFGGTGFDSVNGIAVDSTGNIYVTGGFANTIAFGDESITSAGGSDAFLLKLSSDGKIKWVRHYGSLGNEVGTMMVVDSKDNIIFAGGADKISQLNLGGGPLSASSEGPSIFFAKLTKDGAHVWSSFRSGSGWLSATAMALDHSDNLVVAGSFTGTIDFGFGPRSGVGSNPVHGNVRSTTATTAGSNIFLCRLAGDSGKCLWFNHVGSVGDVSASAIAADLEDDITVAGSCAGPIDFGDGPQSGGRRMFLVAYSALGGFKRSYSVGEASEDPQSLALDANGNLIVIGNLSEKIFVKQLSHSGQLMASWLVGGAFGNFGSSVATDKDGASFITGYISESLQCGDAVAAPSGVPTAFIAKLSL